MKIGFIGVGAMGKPMTTNLLRAGYDLTVYDINQEAVQELVALGARAAASPAQLAQGKDVVITMLPNAKIVATTMEGPEGVFAGAAPGTIIIDMSSVAPGDTKNMAAKAEKLGLSYLDAPVSGGVAGAAKGTLTIMVGGPAETVNRVKEILEVLGQKIYHVGPVGSGDAVKVVNNLLLGINMAAVAEALVLGVKCGLDPEVLFEIISASSGSSYALQAKVPNFVLKGNFEPGFAVDLQYKDLELAVQTGKELQVPLYLTNGAQQIYEAARAAGLGRKDISAVIRLWEKLVGVEVRSGKVEEGP